MAASLLPSSANAGIWSTIIARLTGAGSAAADTAAATGSIQTMELPQPGLNGVSDNAIGGGTVAIAGDAVVPQEGPSGTLSDIEKPSNGTISVYVVRPGDTLSSIAQLFHVSVNTIRWANDISANGTIHPGEQLTILPITGYRYTVKSGDTLASIAKKYGSTASDIGSYNGVDETTLSVGSQIIIPDGEVPSPTAAPAKTTRIASESGSKAKAKVTISASSRVLSSSHASCGTVVADARNPAEPSHNVGPEGTCAQIAYYIAPVAHYIQTQGIHGYNAVDLAAPLGTPIVASASGAVIVARSGGWNGGYGSYVVISHPNGSQTLYAHMSKVAAYDGEHVVQGQVIGYVGMSGEATGPHVHFEIRDGIRNPF